MWSKITRLAVGDYQKLFKLYGESRKNCDLWSSQVCLFWNAYWLNYSTIALLNFGLNLAQDLLCITLCSIMVCQCFFCDHLRQNLCSFVARHAWNRAHHCASLFDRIISRLQKEALNKQTKENSNLEKWIRSIRFFTGNLFSVPLMCLPFSLSYKEICCNFRSTNVKFRDTSFKKS